MACCLDELKKYRQTLVEIVEGRQPDGQENSDEAHNALVESVFLQYCDKIDMFCGRMSVFGQEFYNRIQEEDADNGEYVREEMGRNLAHLLGRTEASLNIFVEDYNEELLTLLQWPDLFRQGVENKRIHIYSLKADKDIKDRLNHVAVGYYRPGAEWNTGIPDSLRDEQGRMTMVRLETDKKHHRAKCVLRCPTDVAAMAEKMFRNFKGASKEIDYAPLFNN